MTQTQRVKPGQYLALRTKINQTTDDGVMVVSGVANDANETDSFGTRIRLSQQALDSFQKNPTLLYNHNVDEPIGKVRSIGYSGSQLQCEVEIFTGVKTPNGTDIQELVRRGALNAFSIRFDEYKSRNLGDYTQIDADVLDELSLVSLPSNRKSLITMRSKGVELHGAGQFLEQQQQAPVDLRERSKLRAGGPLSLDLLTQRLAAAISEQRSQNDDDYWYYGGRAYLVAVYDNFCIWSEYGEATFYQESYSVAADGTVVLGGDILEVLPTWQVVGQAAEENAEAQEDAAEDGVRSGKAQRRTAARLHLDDLKEIVSQLRGAVPTPETTPPAGAEVGQDEVVPLAEGLSAIRGLGASPASEEVTLNDVRQQLRSLIPAQSGAPDA